MTKAAIAASPRRDQSLRLSSSSGLGGIGIPSDFFVLAGVSVFTMPAVSDRVRLCSCRNFFKNSARFFFSSGVSVFRTSLGGEFGGGLTLKVIDSSFGWNGAPATTTSRIAAMCRSAQQNARFSVGCLSLPRPRRRQGPALPLARLLHCVSHFCAAHDQALSLTVASTVEMAYAFFWFPASRAAAVREQRPSISQA